MVNKKILLILIAIIVTGVIVFTTELEPRLNKSWLYEGPIYEAHPLYYDGTIKGMTAKVPEIADLGVKTVYLMPIWDHAHRRKPLPLAHWLYLPNDYYKIADDFGSEKDLKELVDTVHQHGMKIIFDMVTAAAPPKTSIPWQKGWILNIPLAELQKKAEELGLELQYKTLEGNKYVFSSDFDVNKSKPTGKVVGVIVDDTVMLRCFPAVHWGPCVDRSNPEVIKYFSKVAKYYVEKFNIDGWRVDAPANDWNPEIIPGDHSCIKLMREMKNAIREAKPDAILFPESPAVGNPPEPVLDEMCEISYGDRFFLQVVGRLILISGEISPEFMKTLSKEKPQMINMWSKKNKLSAQEIVRLLTNEPILYNRTRARFSETHDLPRLAAMNPSLNRPMAVLLSTIPGVPMIQAGQEIGAKNAFDWSAGTQVDWTNGDYELRDFFKKLFRIRKGSNALKYGSISNVWKSGDNVYAYLREYEGEKVIVAINFQNKEAISYFDLSFLSRGAVLYDELNSEEFSVSDPGNFKILVQAYDSRILTIKR